MTDLQKKDLIISALQELTNDLIMQLTDERKELPTDLSTRKKQWDEIIHNQKKEKEIACVAV